MTNIKEETVKEFLARGGKITKCDYVPPKPKKAKTNSGTYSGKHLISNAYKNQTKTIY